MKRIEPIGKAKVHKHLHYLITLQSNSSVYQKEVRDAIKFSINFLMASLEQAEKKSSENK